MLNEIIVKGNESTTFHNFKFAQTGMDLGISAGSYIQANVERFSTEEGATLSFDTPLEDTHYELWLNDTGLVVLSRTDGEFAEVTNRIDRLAWFTIPAGAISLDDVEINVIRMEVI
jgi:hypothetical protein